MKLAFLNICSFLTRNTPFAPGTDRLCAGLRLTHGAASYPGAGRRRTRPIFRLDRRPALGFVSADFVEEGELADLRGHALDYCDCSTRGYRRLDRVSCTFLAQAFLDD